MMANNRFPHEMRKSMRTEVLLVLSCAVPWLLAQNLGWSRLSVNVCWVIGGWMRER